MRLFTSNDRIDPAAALANVKILMRQSSPASVYYPFRKFIWNMDCTCNSFIAPILSYQDQCLEQDQFTKYLEWIWKTVEILSRDYSLKKSFGIRMWFQKYFLCFQVMSKDLSANNEVLTNVKKILRDVILFHERFWRIWKSRFQKVFRILE